MKRAMCVLLLLMASFVTAGSIGDLDYKDSNLFWDLNREINDNDVDIDSDTLGGKSSSDLMREVDERDDVGSGMSQHQLSNYLVGNYRNWQVWDDYDNYYEFLLDKFISVDLLYRLEARIDYLEARLNKCSCSEEDEMTKFDAALMAYERTGVPQIVDGYTCASLGCIKLTTLG